MLVDKTIKVEQEIDELLLHLVTVISELRAGQGLTLVALQELAQFQTLLKDFKAVPGDLGESLSGTLKAVTDNAVNLAVALLGKN